MADDLMVLPASATSERLLDLPDADLAALRDNLVGNVSFGLQSGAEQKRLVAHLRVIERGHHVAQHESSQFRGDALQHGTNVTGIHHLLPEGLHLVDIEQWLGWRTRSG